MSIKHIRLSLDVSLELNDILEDMADKTHSTKSDVLRKSIVLMGVAVEEKVKGNHLGVISANQEIVKEIVGL